VWDIEKFISLRNYSGMFKQLNYSNTFSFICGMFAFTTLAFPKTVALMVALMVLVVIIGHIKKQFFWKFSWPASLLIALYLAYFIGIFFSEDKSEGWKYAEYKMSFLLLPLLFSVVPKFNFKFHYSIYGLIAGILALIFIGLMNSFGCYSGHTSDWILYCFTSSIISPIHHPSYFSSFILFSIAAIVYGKNQKWWGINKYTFFIYSIGSTLIYLLCLSLAGILFLGGITLILAMRFFYKKIGIKWLFPLWIIAVLFVVFIGSKLTLIKDELISTSYSYAQFMGNPDGFLLERAHRESLPGNEVRLIMWKISVDLIFEHPFGVGTGSVDEYLNARLKRFGLHHLAQHSYNPHNQYLQTALEIGIVGLFILLGLIFSVVHLSIKYRSYLLLLLISGLAFNCLFESMLQRQSGVVFYSFWICLLTFKFKSEENNG